MGIKGIGAMAQALSGTRIRNRRLDMGIRQAELARRCGISPAYLNLIEHNRRRIGGRTLNAIARELGIESAALSEGAEIALVGALRSAADREETAAAEVDRLEEFAGRFPGWARLIEVQSARIDALERTVEMLNDRLAHDPDLSAALHDVLSTVTAIRSTSAILADGEPVEPDWQARFHRNIHEDSRRLADASQHLVAYLDGSGESAPGTATPQEDLESWLAERGFHVAELERALAPEPDTLVVGDRMFGSPASRAVAVEYLRRYRSDALRLPMTALEPALSEGMPDPAQLAGTLGVDLPLMLRRLATVPPEMLPGPVGLITCDASGAITFRRPAAGFVAPRLGAGCPLWPLYQALTRPMVPQREIVAQAAQAPVRFVTYSVAQPQYPLGFEGPGLLEATMLILPLQGTPNGATVREVGSNCRICARVDCPARREPSIFDDSPRGGQEL